MDNAAKIRVVELFAGVGGFRAGLARCASRLKTVWTSQREFPDFSVDTHLEKLLNVQQILLPVGGAKMRNTYA